MSDNAIKRITGVMKSLEQQIAASQEALTMWRSRLIEIVREDAIAAGVCPDCAELDLDDPNEQEVCWDCALDCGEGDECTDSPHCQCADCVVDW